MYGRIVVPVDGSERSLGAADPARELAARFEVDVRFLHVVPPGGQPASELPPDTDVVEGDDVAATIAVAATGDPPGLVCLSSRGRGVVAEAVLGSVARRVVTAVDGPVVVVGPSWRPLAHDWSGRILVPLDGSALAVSVLRPAADWARALGASLRLAHVVTPPDDPSWRPGASMGANLVADDLDRLARELSESGVLADQTVVVHRDPATGIAREAEASQSDLVMLATHGRTGLARVVVGSVAAEVVRAAPVPAVLVRPETLPPT